MPFHCCVCQSTRGIPVLKIPPRFFKGAGNHLATDGLYQFYCRSCGTLINTAPHQVRPDFYARQYKKDYAAGSRFLASIPVCEKKRPEMLLFLTNPYRKKGRCWTSAPTWAHS